MNNPLTWGLFCQYPHIYPQNPLSYPQFVDKT